MTRWFVYEWGKTYTAKTPPGDFQVTIPEISPLSQQAVTNKGILIPYTNLQLNPCPNTQLDLFCSDNFPFDAWLPSTWLTNYVDPSTWLQSPTREGCWLQSSSVYLHDEDQENAWSQNPLMHIHSNFFRRDELGQNLVSGYKLLEQTLLNTWTCIFFDGPLNNPFICLGLWEKKTQTHKHELESAVCRDVVEQLLSRRARTAS